MDPDRWIGLEELENVLGFMCAQVVGDDLAEKADELGTGMPSGVFPMTSPVRVLSAA